jgi:hypothetical protein
MRKIDLKKQLKHLYAPSVKEVGVVDVPPLSFLMVDGMGDPNSTSGEYREAVEVLYLVSYWLKFAAKKGPLQIDSTVMPLEGLWWADDMSSFSIGDRSEWKWTSMIVQPEHVTAEMVEEARAEVDKKKRPPALAKMRFESYDEGKCAQVMHVGPYEAEAPTIERLHAFIAGVGANRVGKHHEIYLSDPRRAAPEKMKTVIRQPME